MQNKQQSILLGGLLAGLLSTSYLGFINFLCCLGIILGALVTVWHYTDTHELTVKPGEGAMLGVFAALVAWLVSFVLNFVLIKVGVRHDLAFTQFILDKMGDSMPPESYDELVNQLEAEVTFGKYLLNGLIGIPISAIFGAIGGAIGAALFKKGPEEETIAAGE